MTDCVWVVSPAEAWFPDGSRYWASSREPFMHGMTIYHRALGRGVWD